MHITKTSNSTGRVEAEKVKEILDNWSVTEKIIACGFDTTAANTGLYKVRSYSNSSEDKFPLDGMSPPYPGTSSWISVLASVWRDELARSNSL